jgi:hypothetical protein
VDSGIGLTLGGLVALLWTHPKSALDRLFLKSD